MVYSLGSDIRLLCGFTEDEASDATLSYYIFKANIHVIGDITVRKKNAILLAGPRSTEWYTQNKPVADVNGDGAVNTSDVQAYTWSDAADESTKTAVTVSQVNWLTGRVVLLNNPGSGKVTADYSYYPNEVDWNILKDAESYYAGFMFAIKKWVHIPEWLKMGTITTRQSVKPYLHLYNEYKRCMNQLKTRKWKKGVAYTVAEPERKRIDELEEEEAEELVFP